MILELFRTSNEAESAEFIVVDDGSTENLKTVREVLNTIEDLFGASVSFIRNRARVGILASNMIAAAQARGDYLAFINTDIFVLRGWLTALLITFNHFPDIGMAGPLHLMEDGTVNEAGNIIFSDASVWKYGKGLQPYRFMTYARPVDYISTAAILIRRNLFQYIGGFHAPYGQGLYEDTDFAMRLRKEGYLIIYQPHSIVYRKHGNSNKKTIEELMVTNRMIFNKAWSTQLKQMSCPPNTQLLVASQRLMRPRLLWVDFQIPRPDYDSGSVRLFEILRILTTHKYYVVFQPSYSRGEGVIEGNIAELQFMGVLVLPIFKPNMPEFKKYWIAQGGCIFDVIVLSRPEIHTIWRDTMRNLCSHVPIIYDTVDLAFIRDVRTEMISLGKASLSTEYFVHGSNISKSQQDELRRIHDADAVVVVSEIERDILRANGVAADKITLLSNIHRVTDAQSTIAPCSVRSGILFVGHFCHLPNQQAMVFFFKEILPQIIQRWTPRNDSLPFINVVGSCTPEKHVIQMMHEHSKYAQFHGWLNEQDLQHMYSKTRVAIAPLRVGAGVKGKINQAMKLGVPIVATPIAVEGMNVNDGQDCLVADSPRDFARSIISLFQDCHLWERLSHGGYNNVIEHFSTKRAERALINLLSRFGVQPMKLENRSQCAIL
ncbi:unnamed protein product [Rotaria magnacalcarata]|uniref:Glycosyltransferase 2-like domain-containing protein n=1 Tax=Rotaria magnacalcarata TaxID=392030 RepID=A0A819WIG2_9BILA|nr:unnamed protein product [Rotaria magnacalcarata]CAF4125342.1 unnamed protein product [Rotaria magnacalcarata]